MVRPGCGCGQVKWVWLHTILHKIMLVNILGVLNIIGRILSSDWQLADSLLTQDMIHQLSHEVARGHVTAIHIDGIV